MKRVLVGMSGGVDSSVTALLLKQQGYEVTGCTMRLYDNELLGEDFPEGGCCSLNDVYDAKAVCRKMDIDHIVMNMSEVFEESVIKPFAESYFAGQTPNPCIECNRRLKFRQMLERALRMGFDYVATGHYANIVKNDDTGRYELHRPVDLHKDQTYVLYTFTQEELAHTLFPLSDYTKEQIREIAEQNVFVNSHKPDSQDICFVPDGDYRSFLKRYTGKEVPHGNFIDSQGNILGEHSGITAYTIGQRRGLGIALGKPVFVTDIDPINNTVTLGGEEELFHKRVHLTNMNYISIESLTKPVRVFGKVRYAAKAVPGTLIPAENGAEIVFDESVRAPAPGQACVMYDDIGSVVGGGVITKAERE